MRDWSGRVVVITGAASGIGRALAIAWSRRGASLALADVNEAGLAATRAMVADAQRESASLSTHVVDVANRAMMAAFARDVRAAHGRVDALVNNAGITVVRRFDESPLEEIDRVLGIDQMGVVHGIHFFLPLLAQTPRSHIVNMSSMIAFVGAPMQSAYCMAKSSVQALSEALRAELAPRGIGVTCVFPGTVRTPLVRDLPAPPLVRRLLERLDGFGIEPSVVAERVIRGVDRNAPRVLIGIDAMILDRLTRLSPGAFPAIATATMRWVQRKPTD